MLQRNMVTHDYLCNSLSFSLLSIKVLAVQDLLDREALDKVTQTCQDPGGALGYTLTRSVPLNHVGIHIWSYDHVIIDGISYITLPAIMTFSINSKHLKRLNNQFSIAHISQCL